MTNESLPEETGEDQLSSAEELLEKIPKEKRTKFLQEMTTTLAMSQLSVGNPIQDKINSQHIDKIIDGVEKNNERLANDRKSNRRYVFWGFIVFILIFVGLLIFFRLQNSDELVLNLVIGGFSFVGGVGGGFALNRFF